jgi:hypothetical protein
MQLGTALSEHVQQNTLGWTASITANNNNKQKTLL